MELYIESNIEDEFEGWDDDKNYATDAETIATVRGWYLNGCDFFVFVKYKYQESAENLVLRHVALEGMKRMIKDAPYYL